MKKQVQQSRTRQATAFVICLALCQSAFAVPGMTALTTVQTALVAAGAVIMTIAVMMVGFKMAFQKVPFHECSHLLWGGILVGGASAIAGVLMAG